MNSVVYLYRFKILKWNQILIWGVRPEETREEVRGGQSRPEETREEARGDARGGQMRSEETRDEARGGQRRSEEVRGGQMGCEEARGGQRRQTYRQYMVKPMLFFLIYYLFIVAIALHFSESAKTLIKIT